MTDAYCQFCVQPISGTVLRFRGANACAECYATEVGWLPPGVAVTMPSPRSGGQVGGAPPLPTRPEVRRLVAKHGHAMQAATARGENPDHVALDHQDQVQAYAARLAPDEAALFLAMYTEELNAWTADLGRKTEDLLVRQEKDRQIGEAIGGAIALGLLFVVALFLMRGCS